MLPRFRAAPTPAPIRCAPPLQRSTPLARMFVAATAALAAGAARAETTLVPYVNSTTSYESNIFRTPDDFDFGPGDPRQKSDVVFDNAIGLEGSYQWSSQRLYAAVEGSRFQYLNNSQLDQNAFELRGGLDWSLFSRVTGTLSASNSQTRASFANGDTTVLNRQKQRDLDATIRFKPANDLEFLGAFNNNLLRTPAIGAPGFEVEENTWNSTLNYIGINRFTIGIVGSYSRGQFSGTANNSSFRSYSGAGSIGYEASDISNFVLSVGYTVRDDEATQSSAEGLTGSLLYNRELTGKTSLNLGAARSVDASQFGDNSVINTSVNLGLNYDATARITARLAYAYLNSDYRTIGTVITPFTGRTDDQHTVTLSAAYAVLDWLSLAPSLVYETRTANIDGFDYDAFIVGLQLMARLER